MKTYASLFSDMARLVGWRSPFLVMLMAAVGLTEGLSVTLLLPLLSELGIRSSSNQQGLAALLDRAGTAVGLPTGLYAILTAIIAVAAIQAVLSIVLNWWSAILARRYQSEWRLKLFKAFIHAQWRFLVSRRSGELTNAVISETERVANAGAICLHIVSALIVTIIYLGFGLLIGWQITVGIIVLAIVMSLSVSRLYRMSFAIGRSIAPLNAELQTAVTEHIAGVKVVKATTSEDRVQARIETIVRRLERANTVAGFVPGLVRAVFEFAGIAALAGLLVAGQQSLGVAPANIIVVLALFLRLFPRITTLQVHLHSLTAYLHADETLRDVLAEAQAQAEHHGEADLPAQLRRPFDLIVRRVTVEIDGRVLLSDIDLKIPVPGMTGIVGMSGSGKSTFLHVMLGLFMPMHGSVTLGGHQLAPASVRDWRRRIGYVPQETVLFHASIRDNIMLSKPDASEEDVKLAARRAHAHAFIEALPQGYDTIIGDQGIRLSGGQRQRLAIARALVANPVLLLLDEATSALDADSEAEVMAALNELRGQMGIVLVAHHLAAVHHADMVAVFESGRLIAYGPWERISSHVGRLESMMAAVGHEQG